MSTKLKFSDDSEKLIFDDISAKLKFSDTFKKLIFDVTLPSIGTGIGFMIIGSTNIVA